MAAGSLEAALPAFEDQELSGARSGAEGFRRRFLKTLANPFELTINSGNVLPLALL